MLKPRPQFCLVEGIEWGIIEGKKWRLRLHCISYWKQRLETFLLYPTRIFTSLIAAANHTSLYSSWSSSFHQRSISLAAVWLLLSHPKRCSRELQPTYATLTLTVHVLGLFGCHNLWPLASMHYTAAAAPPTHSPPTFHLPLPLPLPHRDSLCRLSVVFIIIKARATLVAFNNSSPPPPTSPPTAPPGCLHNHGGMPL